MMGILTFAVPIGWEAQQQFTLTPYALVTDYLLRCNALPAIEITPGDKCNLNEG